MNSSKTFKMAVKLHLMSWPQNIWIMCTNFFLSIQRILWKLKILLKMYLLNFTNHLNAFDLKQNLKHTFFELTLIRLIHLFKEIDGEVCST